MANAVLVIGIKRVISNQIHNLAHHLDLDPTTRTNSNTKFKRHYSKSVDRANSNIAWDQTGVLTIFYSSKDHPATLDRVVANDERGKRIKTFFGTTANAVKTQICFAVCTYVLIAIA